MKSVARVGDVRPTASTGTKFPKEEGATAEGAWAVVPGTLSEVPVPTAESDDRAVVRSASCTFLFTGTAIPGGQPFMSSPSVVRLAPTAHVLTVSGSRPLFDGDQAKDEFGNTLTVSSSATWRSA
jgi:hypothetical protein